jgi:hypothetical protein
LTAATALSIVFPIASFDVAGSLIHLSAIFQLAIISQYASRFFDASLNFVSCSTH